MDIQALLNSLPGAISQGVIWGIMAIGVYITFKILDLADLTVDGTLGLGGIVMVVCTINGMSIPLAMIIAFGAGCLAGLVTGIFHTKFGIPAILAGILTQLSLYSIYLGISNGRANVTLSVMKYDVLVTLRNTTKTIIVGALFCVVIIAVLYWFFGTEVGQSLRATGCNQAMSRANGINTNVNKVIGLILSNGLVGLSGALLAQYNGNADVNMGRGAIVIGLAAVIIGEVLFGKLFKNFALKLLASVIGAIIYYLVLQLVLWFGLPTNYLKLFSAVVVALFLGIPYWQRQISSRRVREPKVANGGAENA